MVTARPLSSDAPNVFKFNSSVDQAQVKVFVKYDEFVKERKAMTQKDRHSIVKSTSRSQVSACLDNCRNIVLHVDKQTTSSKVS